MYTFKTLQKKQKRQWVTESITNGTTVPEMLINDMAAKYIYKQNKIRIIKDHNGITVYYTKKIRAIYSDNSGKII